MKDFWGFPFLPVNDLKECPPRGQPPVKLEWPNGSFVVLEREGDFLVLTYDQGDVSVTIKEPIGAWPLTDLRWAIIKADKAVEQLVRKENS